MIATGAVGVALAASGADSVAPAQAAGGPRVDVMVVGRTRTLAGARRVTARRTTVRVGQRRCGVRSGTPLTALAARDRIGGPSFRLRDYGRCSKRVGNAGSLFVTRVGGDSNRGRSGWVYKVGRRLGTAGAGDPSGPFGRGRLRGGQNLLWFWCRMSRAGSCQRTLEIHAAQAIKRGRRIAVSVRAYDDHGRSVAARSALVAFGFSRARTNSRGVAVLRAPSRRGTGHLRAARRGTAPAFPLRVAVR